MILGKNNSEAKKGSALNISNDKVFELIKKRAHDLYCRRGRVHGRDIGDWIEAERQVKKELGLNR